MKRTTYILLLCLSCLIVKGQVETYTNYSFNNCNYDAFVIRMNIEAINKFEIIQNDSILNHQVFLTNIINRDPSFFLINACISDTNCNPIGYYVNNGQLIKPLNLKDGNGNFYLKPNGALLFTKDDVDVCESSMIVNYQNIRLGVQSGPMLLINGLINPVFNQNSSNKYLRCGVGLFVNNKGEKFLVFAISNSPVSFYDFADFFSKKFKCNNALCLESAGSAIYFPGQSYPNDYLDRYICNYLYLKF